MDEFALLFRQHNFAFRSDPEKMKVMTKKWQEWMGGIAAQGRLVGQPTRLDLEGKVLKPGGVVTDGPFVEIKEKLGGLIVVQAESFDDAVTLAHGCPVLEVDGTVEVRRLTK